MKGKAVSATVLILLLTCTLTLAVRIQPVKAIGTIYIRIDGTVYPSTAPIRRDGGVYTFTGDIFCDSTDGIVIERNNMILNGAGYTLSGGWCLFKGIDLTGRTNVTVMNTHIDGFGYAIWLNSSSGNSISGNRIGERDSSGHSIEGIVLYQSFNNSISENTIIGFTGPTVLNRFGISLYSSSGNNISRNNIHNIFEGIVLYQSSNNSISGNNETWNRFGVLLDSSSGNSIRGNCIADSDEGIVLYQSSNNSISGNNETSNGFGVLLDSSSGNSIRGNTFNQTGLYVRYSYLNSVVNNTVNGKPLVYLEGVADISIGEDAGQVILVRCDRIRVEGLDISGTGIGVQLLETDNSIIYGNNITNNRGIRVNYGVGLLSSSGNNLSGNNLAGNRFGISMDSSSGNSISGNNIVDSEEGIKLNHSSGNSISGNNITNNYYGVKLASDSNYNSISGNTITKNEYCILLVYSSFNVINRNNVANSNCGMGLQSSSNNSIFHNNFIDNIHPAYILSLGYGNVWDDSYPSGGNYWSDYVGVDFYGGPYHEMIGSDGMGDRSYVIDADNQDRYPLVDPWVPTPTRGDVDSSGTVDISDVIIWASAFGSQPGDPNWEARADLIQDNAIDIFDGLIIATNFGKTRAL